MMYPVSRSRLGLGSLLGAVGLVALLAGCTPKVTPQQLEVEFTREVPENASVRQVEEFLEQREIGYSRAALDRSRTLYAAIRGVKGRPVRSYDILLEFHFDAADGSRSIRSGGAYKACRRVVADGLGTEDRGNLEKISARI